ncbi:MAG: putative molybdenum carrier protein [Thermoanaerobaculaceae bacterium]|nr:putative molybdenum carrier protein [Thermoanaerobaculaceae bacterium]MDI9623081.1 putative molybdenum carrier protein [Acidobacteriota bacterium]NLH11372.1 molybdenum cofactor carrier [Holophagae bacterium]HPW55396.1 putative molybdenum carrier protein [Thermoanaerobaculaceae bacterium]
MLEMIIAGGQTGVDRAALDAALELGFRCGGWCPRGRKAEDGRIPMCYPLRETPDADYRSRTEWNVRDADATLVLVWGPGSGGTQLSINLAQWLDKPLLVVDLAVDPNPEEVRAWLASGGFESLNVAGPRESSSPGIHRLAHAFLLAALAPAGSPAASA